MSIFPNCTVEIMVGKDFGQEDSMLRVDFQKTENTVYFEITDEVAQLLIQNIIKEVEHGN